MQIGGTTKLKKSSQPQYVVQKSGILNEYLLFKLDDVGTLYFIWVGDPNSATKFDSKYQAKTRVREFEDVPATRCFKELERV